MVRMDECVEAIFDKDTNDDKQKTLRMIRVLKGAISVSKSKTGECIFRNNKLEARDLKRTIKNFHRDSQYIKEKVDTQKRFVVNRWRHMLEKQTTVNSQSMLEEILDIKEPTHRTDTCKDDTEDSDTVLKKFLDFRLQRLDTGINWRGFPSLTHPQPADDKTQPDGIKKNDESEEDAYVTERKEIRRQRNALDVTGTPQAPLQHKVQGSVLCRNTPVRLPSVTNTGFHGRRGSTHSLKESIVDKGSGSQVRRGSTQSMKEPIVEKSKELKDGVRAFDDRDLTDWKDWQLKDNDWLLEYIRRQKTRHEDLLIRNALQSIESDMSGQNLIRRQQVLVRLRSESTAESNAQATKLYKMARATSGPARRTYVRNSFDSDHSKTSVSDTSSVKSAATFPRTNKKRYRSNGSLPAGKPKLGEKGRINSQKAFSTTLGESPNVVGNDIGLLSPPKQSGILPPPKNSGLLSLLKNTENSHKDRRSSLRKVSGALCVIPEIQIIPPATTT